MARPNEDLDNRDALSNTGGSSPDPRPTSVNDTRTQPETSQDTDNNRLSVDAGSTRTAAFDEGSGPRDEARRTGQSSDDAATASRH